MYSDKKLTKSNFFIVNAFEILRKYIVQCTCNNSLCLWFVRKGKRTFINKR